MTICRALPFTPSCACLYSSACSCSYALDLLRSLSPPQALGRDHSATFPTSCSSSTSLPNQTTFYTTQQPCPCPPSFSNRACPSTSPKDPSRSICRPRGQLKRHASSLSSAASKAWPFPKVSRLAWEDLGLVMESSSRIRCWIACWYVSIKARVEAFVVLVVLDGGKRLCCACGR